jgi:rSAM/selenodomain-associated transferase 1
MPAPDLHLVVIAKSPLPGRVKTRLCPPYSSVEAAVLAEAALQDTLDAVEATPAAARTIALDGPIGAWLPQAFSVTPQRGDGLDERLAAAFRDAQAHSDRPVLLIGMDTPQVTPELLTRCGAPLLVPGGPDTVLGMATDGGWWALGLRRAQSSLLHGVPMSTSGTGAAQLERLRAAGLTVELLPELVDVDDAASADEVARIVPGSRFSCALGSVALAMAS